MTFQVSACNDAHVILMTGNTESEKHYFIAFGGWGNTMSIIEDEYHFFLYCQSILEDEYHFFLYCHLDEQIKNDQMRTIEL